MRELIPAEIYQFRFAHQGAGFCLDESDWCFAPFFVRAGNNCGFGYGRMFVENSFYFN